MGDEVKKIYNKIAETYHQLRLQKKPINEFIEMPATLSLLKNVKGKKILDLGCGSGIYAKILKKRGAKVFGIDISEKMIEIAKREVKDVDFRVGSVYKLPYKSEYFDLVLSSLTVDHFKDLNKAFKEIHRVLKKNGVFIFSISNPLSDVVKGFFYKKKYRPRSYFKEGKVYTNWSIFKIKMLFYRYTFQTYIRTLIKNGFNIEDFVDAKSLENLKKVNPLWYKVAIKIPIISVFKVRK